jgi:ribosomal protein L16/L10AE
MNVTFYTNEFSQDIKAEIEVNRHIGGGNDGYIAWVVNVRNGDLLFSTAGDEKHDVIERAEELGKNLSLNFNGIYVKHKFPNI